MFSAFPAEISEMLFFFRRLKAAPSRGGKQVVWKMAASQRDSLSA
jgi:hypothetical protein